MADSDEEMEVVEVNEGGDVEEAEDGENGQSRVFLPGRDQMDEDEALEMDEKAYKLYYSLTPEWSCMSFDIIRDNLGDSRAENYPLTTFLVTGTSATSSHLNKIQVLKLSNLRPLRSEEKEGSDSESDSDSESEDLDAQAEVEVAALRHNGVVNRVRCTEHGGACLAASWSEHGIVYVWDLSRPLGAVNDSLAMAEFLKERQPTQPTFVFNGHRQEGYAMDWNQQSPGTLLTGDCTGQIHLWKPQAASWSVSAAPFAAHTASVEDLQWSPTESTVFCSASVDRSLRVWDVRAPPSKACQITVPDAHATDVNVISWNRKDTSLIVSGADDGHLKVWDLRQFMRRDGTGPTPVVALKHHSDPITAVEWHPCESSVFAASASGPNAGDQLTMWDISVEQSAEGVEEGLPAQLMFVHMGQKELKELHWHPQMPGLMLSTAADSFNVFRTVNI